MKRNRLTRLSALIAGGALFLLTGCDWSSGGGSSGYNTSQGAGLNINFSGVYRGELSSGRAVSGQNITTLTLAQTGNRINVVDNNGSAYQGAVGSPGLVARPLADGTYPAGAELVQGQVNFSGINKATGRNITFAGIIHVISVTDIQGSSSSSSSTTGNNATSTTTSQDNNDGTTTITETIRVVSPDGVYTYDEVVVTVVNTASGEVLSETTTRTNETTNNTTSEFRITGANSQYRMEGTWVEEGGGTSSFKARSPGTSGLIQTTTTATTDTGAATQ